MTGLLKKATALISALLLLTACGAGTPPEDNGTSDSATRQTEPGDTADITEDLPMDVIERLGLSVTEGGFAANSVTNFRKRIADYMALGIKTVRMDTVWNTTSQNDWKMNDYTAQALKAAADIGLELKLVSPTVMAIPSYLAGVADARFVDYNGRQALNSLSYWYSGIEDYCAAAIRGQLAAYRDAGILGSVSALIVDFGAAGEPLYPPAWTQASDGLDSANNGEEVLWCYGDNAHADFRRQSEEKYGDIAAANTAWGSDYTSFAEVSVPRPGEVTGQLWDDVLTWYRDTKREFIEAQIKNYIAATEEFSDGRIKLILYIPGAYYTENEYTACVNTGTASAAIKIGADNHFIADMAKKYGCLLQMTGLPDVASLSDVLFYMYENGMGDIPVFGENAGGYEAAKDPDLLATIISDYKLAGIDYTHTRHLYKTNGVSKSDIYPLFETALESVKDHVSSLNLDGTPPSKLSYSPPAPAGDVLKYSVDLQRTAESTLAYAFYLLGSYNYTVEEGDVLEYDVMLSEPVPGYGAVDAMVGGGTLRDNGLVADSRGCQAHPNRDISSYAYPGWYHRSLDISVTNTVGTRLSDVWLAAHPEQLVCDHVDVYYDNITIVNNGKVKLVIFADSDDLSSRSGIAFRLDSTAKLTVIDYESLK